jgi:hypothetical protein
MHSNIDERSILLAQLTDWLLQARDARLWHEVLFGACRDAIELGRHPGTVLRTDRPRHWAPEDAERFAADAGGRTQAVEGSELLFIFETPATALRAALQLQRDHRTHRLRTAMVTGHFAYALIPDGGRARRIYFGDELVCTERAIRASAAGTLQMCARSYSAVCGMFATEAPDAVITTELIGDEVLVATILLPPSHKSQLSTFAGLGIT